MLLLATLSLILLLSSCAGKGFNRLEMTKDLTYPNSDHSLDKDIAAFGLGKTKKEFLYVDDFGICPEAYFWDFWTFDF